MSTEVVFNKSLIDQFKKNVNYETLIQQPPKEKQVTVDWMKELKEIVDANGDRWVGDVSQPSIDSFGFGTMDVRLKSASSMIVVTVTSLRGDWSKRLDHVIGQLSLTNRPDINAKVDPSEADLYLVPKYSPRERFAKILYGNFYISLAVWDEGNVDPVAKSLLKIMQDNSHSSVPNGKPQSFSLSADKANMKVGDIVKVELTGLVSNWASEWVYLQQSILLEDSLKPMAQDDSVFTFKAEHEGIAEIRFLAMHRRTMLLSSESVEVVIE